MILAMQPSDARVTTRDCTEGARLFVWCIRRWVMLRFQNRDPVPLLRTVLEQHRIPEAASDMDQLMCAIAAHARRRLDVRCAAGVDLSCDELILTRALSSAMANADLAAALLRLLADRAGVPGAVRDLQHIAAALRCCGMEADYVQPFRNGVPDRSATCPIVRNLPGRSGS
jgi:hypothetical protein